MMQRCSGEWELAALTFYAAAGFGREFVSKSADATWLVKAPL